MTQPIDPPDTEPRRSLPRQLFLGGFVFVATLVILVGLGAVVRGSVTASPTPSASRVAMVPATEGPSGTIGPSSPLSSPDAAPSGDPVLIGAGDIASCDRDDDRRTAAILADQPGIVFTAGDNVYPSGTLGQFADCYDPTWGRELQRTRPVPGNHDHETAGLAGYLGYFGDAAKSDGTTWYSYELGDWHVIALDATCAAAGGCGPDSEQGRWLAADLAASPATCTLAIWHQPRFSSGEHGNDASVEPFWDALYAAGADVVVNGHDHDYERFAPQDPAGQADRTRGIREFVVGTGGAELRGFSAQAANSELRVAGYFGVIRFVLHRSSYEWSFLTTAGVAADAGLGFCH